jgi:hypothetical protein
MKNSKELLQKLADCIAACEKCSNACLEEDMIKEMRNCIKTDRDCADICNTTYRLVARNSDNASAMLKVCADICRKCVEECEHHDMQHCQDCAKACNECEKACKAA